MKATDINARIVTLPGKSIKSLINQKSSKSCQCTLCKNNLPCTQRNFIYSAQCRKCQELYIGASRRPAHERFSEHEHSTRKFNDRTTLGQHLMEKHMSSKPLNIPNKVDYTNLLNQYHLKIEKTAKDTLELFLKEHTVKFGYACTLLNTFFFCFWTKFTKTCITKLIFYIWFPKFAR